MENKKNYEVPENLKDVEDEFQELDKKLNDFSNKEPPDNNSESPDDISKENNVFETRVAENAAELASDLQSDTQKFINNDLNLTQQIGMENDIDNNLNKLQLKFNEINDKVPQLSDNIFKLKSKYESLKDKLNSQIEITNKILQNFKITFDKFDLLTKDLPENYTNIINSVDGISKLTPVQVNEILTKMIENLTIMIQKIEKDKNGEIEQINKMSSTELKGVEKKLQDLQNSYNMHQSKIKTTIGQMLNTSDNIISEINNNILTLNTNSPEQTVTQSGGKRQKRNKKVTNKAKVKNNSKKRNKKTRSKKNKRTRKHRN